LFYRIHSLVLHIYHSLRVGIAEVAFMRRARVDLGLIQWISHFIREHASGEARDELRGVREVGCVQNVIVDQDVIAEERQLVDRDEHLSADKRRCFHVPCISCF